MRKFTDFLQSKKDLNLLEMAVKGDIVKTPILFDQDDINFLYQFPPRFWQEALYQRYNDHVLGAKEGNPDQQQITIDAGHGKKYVFNINTGGSKLVDRLEKDIDLNQLSNLNPHDKDQYSAGHYGYDLSGKKSIEDKKTGRKLTITDGYVPMGRQVAANLLSKWRKSISNGWLDDDKFSVKNLVKRYPELGQGKNPVWPEPVIHKLVERLRANGADVEAGPGGKMIWNVKQIDKNGRESMQRIESHLPILRPGKLIDAAAVRKYDELVAKAEAAKEKGRAEEAQQLQDEADEVQKNAPKHSEFEYNVHKHNPRYPTMWQNIHTHGGFNPNRTTQPEKLVSNEDDKEMFRPYIFGRQMGDGGGDARWYVLGPWAKIEGATGDEKWIAHGPIRKGISSELNIARGRPYVGVLNSMFDELVTLGVAEAEDKTRDPAVANFLDAVKNNAPKETLKKFYELMNNKLMHYGRDVVRRAAQLDLGGGTRRKRRGKHIQSMDDAISGGEGGKAVSKGDLIGTGDDRRKSMMDFEPTGPETQKLGPGDRFWRKAGGTASGRGVYFGHHIANLKEIIKQAEAEIDNDSQAIKNIQQQAPTTGSLGQDIEIRKNVFDNLVQIYIAQQMSKLGASGQTIDQNSIKDIEDAANDYANANIIKVLANKGVKVSSAPRDLAPKLYAASDDAAEMLSATGREGEAAALKSSAMAQKLMDPSTIEYLKNNPQAMAAAEKAVENDPEGKSLLLKIKQKMMGDQPMQMAARQMDPNTVAQNPVGGLSADAALKAAASPRFIHTLKTNPQVRAAIEKMAHKHPILAAALQKANEL